MIKVLIVEDSRVAQEFLAHILSFDPDMEVVGIAGDGADALAMVLEKHPDVITMDIHMPKMNGFEATRKIMENAPTPIVIVSASTGSSEVDSNFRALEAGALAMVLRPPGMGHPDHAAAVRDLIRTVKLMSEIKVVRRHSRAKQTGALPPLPVMREPATARDIRLLAIGASTGGPPVLHKILSLLPHNLGVPVLIVQHIAAGFVEGFAHWLTNASGFPVLVAAHNENPLAGHAYVAPDGFHIGISKSLRISLSNHAAENGLRPSVAYLFRTTALALGPRALGVLLTGMGRDGSDELKLMRDAGAITIAQDQASSIVHGMPGEAIKLDGATYILPPEGIAKTVIELIRRSNGPAK
jgi:two-component system chemotaxis response regulator CheB